jgi:hypothetical protein
MLALEFISCSWSLQTKDESRRRRRRRDSRSKISEEVAGELPYNSRYRPRRAAERLVRRSRRNEQFFTQENHVFSRVGLAVQEPIPDSLKRACLE